MSLIGRTIEVLSKKMGVFMDAKGKLTALARKRDVYLGAKTGDKKRDTLERMSLYRLNHSRVLQRRVIRVSETFGESLSSGEARSDRRERPACP